MEKGGSSTQNVIKITNRRIDLFSEGGVGVREWGGGRRCKRSSEQCSPYEK
jgi:hypothetical protein